MSEIKNCLTGLAVGDAFGVPIEETERMLLLRKPVLEMLGDLNYGVPVGSWSDDTSMTLATIDSILETGTIDINNIADKMCEWVNDNKYTPNNELFSIKDTTRFSLMRYWDSKDARTSGGVKPSTNDNGAIIRMSPIALYAYYKKLNEKELFEIVSSTCSITHANKVAVLASFIYVKFMIYILNGNSIKDSYKLIKKYKYEKYFDEELKEADRIINQDIGSLPISEIESDDYCIHILEACIWVLLNTDSYESSIIGAVNLGECTDNVASLVGAIAGIYYKNKSIPKKWADKLIRKDYIDKMARKFNSYLTK